MPASNRRPLWDDGDAPQPSDTMNGLLEAQPAVSQPAQFSTPAAAATAQAAAAFKQPCTFKGAASALYAGMLGYFLGVVPATIKFKARQWGMIHTQGLASAQQLGLMTGMYTAIHCICQRIRMVEDGWNRGIAGCSTGLVLGWSNGPWSALQSCAGLGLISALIDLGGGVEAAEARALQPLQLEQPQQQQHATQHHQRRHAHTMKHHEQQHPASTTPLLQGLPQPAQLLALLLGAPPGSMSSTSGVAGGTELSTDAQQLRQQQQQQPPDQANSSRRQQGLVLADRGVYQGLVHSHQQQQQQQDPLAAAAALMLQPAAHAVHQVLSAPPLMFLGTCCHGLPAAGAAAAAAAEVDGCPIRVAPAAKRPGKPPV